mgnify:CR=1 FL=1
MNFPNGTLILVILSSLQILICLRDTFHFKTYIFDVMFLHYSDLPSHTALLYLSENALKSFVPARSAFLYRLLSLPSFVEIYGDVYDPISVVFLTAAIVFRLHLFSNDRAVHPTLQIMLHYLSFLFSIYSFRWTFAFASK